MPTIKSMQAALYPSAADQRATADVAEAAEEARKAAHREEVAAAAQARNPQKDES